MSYQYQFINWQEGQQQLMEVRTIVFVEEQNVPVELEQDEFDDESVHLLVTDSDKAIATCRLLKDGHIGRMCVLKEYRGQGIGSEMIFMLIQHGFNKGFKTLLLNAQVSAMPFYEKAGFTVCSDVFMEAGIEHKTMQLNF